MMLRARILVAVSLACAVVLPCAVPAQGQTRKQGERRLPQRNDAGDWNGTWYYTNRDFSFALWFRGEPERPEVQLQYVNSGTAERFLTEWDGTAEYVHRALQGRFQMELVERDENTMRGTWNWTLGSEETGRVESGEFSIYRTGDGRQFALVFDRLTREHRGGRNYRIDMEPVWIFRKSSRRHVAWGALPF